MSQIQVDTIYNRDATGAPNFPNGATVTGVITATSGSFTSGSFSGNVSVGGTLTYEDVTSIDSVGIVTARQGIKVLAGGINAVGVITATSYVGDASGMTNAGISAGKAMGLAAFLS